MPDVPAHWRVHVLCAQWCGVCRDYVPFVQAQGSTDEQWVWVDVETHADLLGDLDVDNFPFLLITEAGAVRFLGTVTPQLEVAQRLVHALRQGHRYALPPIEGLDEITRHLQAL
jgi:thioredoxin 1